MRIIKPSIRDLSEDQVRAALDSKNEDNLIVVEFGLLLRDLITECSRLMQVKGRIDELLNAKPSCAIEKIALELLSDMVAAGVAPAFNATDVLEEEQQEQ